MRITRRHLIALTGASAGLAAMGALGVFERWWDRPHGEGLAVLSLDEYEFLQAMAEAWMPRGGTPALSGADANLGAFVDDLLTHVDPPTPTLLKALFQGLDDKPIGGWFAAYRHLPLEDRQILLRQWLDHDNALFRGGVSGTIALLGFGWTTHPDVAKLLQPWYGCGYGR